MNPFQTIIVPSCWQCTVQTMLEKDQGQPWLHCLPIIELKKNLNVDNNDINHNNLDFAIMMDQSSGHGNLQEH